MNAKFPSKFINKNQKDPVIHKITFISGILAAIFAVITVLAFIFNNQINEKHVQKATHADIVQEIGSLDSNHLVFTGVKNDKMIAYKTDNNLAIKEQQTLNFNHNKISYLTLAQIYKNFPSDKISVNKQYILINNKKYLPVYYGMSDQVSKLIPENKKDKKRVLKLKQINMYLTNKKALKTLKNNYHIDFNKAEIIKATANNKQITYEFFYKNKPYKIIIRNDKTVALAKGRVK